MINKEHQLEILKTIKICKKELMKRLCIAVNLKFYIFISISFAYQLVTLLINIRFFVRPNRSADISTCIHLSFIYLRHMVRVHFIIRFTWIFSQKTKQKLIHSIFLIFLSHKRFSQHASFSDSDTRDRIK